jgi:hypothetical protein
MTKDHFMLEQTALGYASVAPGFGPIRQERIVGAA